MPVIPRYESQVQLQSAQIQDIPLNAADDQFEAWNRIGKSLSKTGLEISEKLRQADEAAEAASATAQAALQMSELRNNTIMSTQFNTDPEAARKEWFNQAQNMGSQIVQNIKSQRARAYFQMQFSKTLANHAIAMGERVVDQRIALQRGSMVASVNGFSEAASRADDDSVYRANIREGIAVIKGAVRSGHIKPEQESPMIEQLKDSSFENRIRSIATRDPLAAQRALEKGVLEGQVSAGKENALRTYLKPLVETNAARAIAMEGIGALSQRFESGGDPGAIGYDEVGGPSYGTYQIATKPGTFRSFMDYAKSNAPEIHKRLSEAGDPGAGGKEGSVQNVWKQIAKEDPKGFSKLQHDFMAQSHYDPARKAIAEKTGFDVGIQPEVMQQVLWSTAAGHGPGGATKIFNQAIAAVGTDDPKRLIDTIYEIRKTKYGSSTPSVRASVQRRYNEEASMAKGSLASQYIDGEQIVRSRAQQVAPGDPLFEEKAINEYRQEFNRQRELEALDIHDKKNLLLQSVIGANPVNSVSELISDPSRADAYSVLVNKDPGFIKTLEASLATKDKKKDPEASARRYYELFNMAHGTPEQVDELANRSLFELDHSVLTDGDWAKAVTLQDGARTGKRNMKIETARQTINRIVNAFYGPEPSDERKKQEWLNKKAQAYSAAESAVFQEMEDLKDKTIDNKRIDSIARGVLADMLIEGTGISLPLFGGTWGQNKARLFERPELAEKMKAENLSQLPAELAAEAEKRKRANEKITAHFDPKTRRWYLISNGKTRIDYVED